MGYGLSVGGCRLVVVGYASGLSTCHLPTAGKLVTRDLSLIPYPSSLSPYPSSFILHPLSLFLFHIPQYPQLQPPDFSESAQPTDTGVTRIGYFIQVINHLMAMIWTERNLLGNFLLDGE